MEGVQGTSEHSSLRIARAVPPSRELRGVTPAILLEQVRVTLPFLFGEPVVPETPYTATLLATDRLLRLQPDYDLSHARYFRLCVSAHWATVASFVPTDVDNQIRFRLWHPALDTSVILEMKDTVIESAHWTIRPLSTKWVACPDTCRTLSGHDGEWFSIAVGCYGALRNRAPAEAAEIRDLILAEMEREAKLLERLAQKGDGISMLLAAGAIAHNLGDLDRVVDMWHLPETDELKRAAYKAGHEGEGWLVIAGKLNKLFMADENPRHFSLRGPKCLRRSPDLLLPACPFLDEWGGIVGKHPALADEERAEVAEALIDGWEWLANKRKAAGPVGYARALAGIADKFPGGFSALCDFLPARVAKRLRTGTLRTQCAVERERFEEQWRRMALNALR